MQAVSLRTGYQGSVISLRHALIAFLCILVIQPFYAWCWSLDPPDIQQFLIPWYQEIVREGRLSVFAEPFSNYSPPYLYALSAASLADGLTDPKSLIRLLSLALTLLLSGAMVHLMRRMGLSAGQALLAGAGLFFVPSVIANAAMLGQSDMLWTAPCLMAIAAAISRRPVAMLFWCGLAFAVKAQAAFLAPFALGALLAMRPRWWHWGVPFAGYAVGVLPAWLLGWPASHLATIYLGQTQHFAGLISMGAANPWLLLTYFDVPDGARFIPLAYALGAAGFAGAGWIAWAVMKDRADPGLLLAAALLPALALPWLLPMMHERYFYLADVLAVALWAARPNVRHATILLATQLGSVAGLLAYVTGEAIYVIHGDGVATFTLAAGRSGVIGATGVYATSAALLMTLYVLWAGTRKRSLN
jgi:hypothetical protein